MVRHSFTPEQANRTLPLVAKIVEDILQRGRELREAMPHVHEEGRAQRIAVLEREIRELLIELERIGCSYKDWGFQYGLVDFPGEIEGAPVLLCWRSDEPEVGWYHDHESGFAGRKPIPERLLRPARSTVE